MMQAYLQEGMTKNAVFSLFVRRLPATRNYLIACGVETVLDAIETFRVTREDIAYLSTLGLFTARFLEWLKKFRFKGEIHAVPDGAPIFANEPILEVVAPLPEAQFLETLVMNHIHLQTLIASKAARVVAAARGRKVIDFGARRMHGIDAANNAARASYIAGVDATSNAGAGHCFGIPVTGTMGHSYVQAHDSEKEAFEAFSAIFPGTVLLIDTYDTLGAAKTAIDLARRKQMPISVSAVRLDSGDLLALSRQVRLMLDEAGLNNVQIVASGGLDEFEIAALVEANAPIDSFGVGTSMGVSADSPALDIAYKLTEYNSVGRMKLSAGKATLPGRKQIFRNSRNNVCSGDVIAQSGECLPGAPLLECVMRNGSRVAGTSPSLDVIRKRTRESIASLPRELVALAPAISPYDVAVSPALLAYEADVRRAIARQLDEAGMKRDR